MFSNGSGTTMSISRHSASHHYNKMMSQKSNSTSNGNHSSFFSTEPRRSSSKPTKPSNGFLRNGGSTHLQQYEKISSTLNPVSNQCQASYSGVYFRPYFINITYKNTIVSFYFLNYSGKMIIQPQLVKETVQMHIVMLPGESHPRMAGSR